MASALHWIPDSLYNSAIAAVVTNFTNHQKALRTFHANVLFDVYYKLYKEGCLCQLEHEFSKLEVFDRLLRMKDNRYLLHHCFQALMDQGSGIARNLANSYKIQCSVSRGNLPAATKAIELGLLLGYFLSDAGWFPESEKVAEDCLELCKTVDTSASNILHCYVRLLHSRNSFCKFQSSEETFIEAHAFVEKMLASGQSLNLAALYSEFSTLFFCRSNYNEAYKWSTEALKELSSCRFPDAAVAVLRQASKACVVKREFKRAKMLIKQALLLCRSYFGNRHPITAATLIDYGFYLLNVDSICHSIKVHQTALETRQCIFGGQNLLVAIAHEDLAYAFYVHEYNTGRFKDANEHAEKALEIMHNLLPDDHLLLASSKRVKALILEELAIDSHDKPTQRRLLLEAQELHTSALHLAQEAFGEMNVQTAKHYGNLGRLYQSMRRFEEAKEMHLKAIKIKEHILGQEDYEVALSVGHLASLYNYDMMLFEKAEELYLRSVKIGIKIFGDGYSGLEYDYRGLLRVYQRLNKDTEANKYLEMLHQWKLLRGETAEVESETSPLTIDVDPIPLDEIYFEFTSIA